MNIFQRIESEVRSYCRLFPTVFVKASGYRITDDQGKEYVDFFSGAGALNYGHNDPFLKQRLLDYLMANGVVHSLDMSTAAKGNFLELFREVILERRNLDYKVQFVGPTGTNAVEAALKLARKVTGRSEVVSFTNGFHGMTLGSLSLCGNRFLRAGAGVPLSHVVRMPYDGYLGEEVDTLEYVEQVLNDSHSGIEAPAAFIVETIQAEGGVNLASFDWLRRLKDLAESLGALLIVDDIQVGVGRSGPFFSFEPAGIVPDIVCLSKAISGFGLPMALVLMRPQFDVWKPGEHTGTFRGNNLAFVTAAASLSYWCDDSLTQQVLDKADRVRRRLEEIISAAPPEAAAQVRGRGLIYGLAFADRKLAGRVARQAFERGLIIEPAGVEDSVLKLMPPLTIDDEGLETGLDIIAESLAAASVREGRGALVEA